ncbi:MAG: hypothetical protein H6Q89_4588, partial [Myxococcaceae bacterium]|nr:hypothetical protein [Myxococcaceae bacterium]
MRDRLTVALRNTCRRLPACWKSITIARATAGAWSLKRFVDGSRRLYQADKNGAGTAILLSSGPTGLMVVADDSTVYWLDGNDTTLLPRRLD